MADIKTTKVALVSGSSRGIGFGIASLLAENGYSVFVNGRREEDVLSAIAKINSPVARPVVLDLTLEKNFPLAMKAVLKEVGRLDLVVCNIGSGRSINGWDVELFEFKRIFDINFFGAVGLATAAISTFQKKNLRGHIIFIASIAGCESLGAPLAYMSAKAALLSYAKALSQIVGKLGIRVNCVSPGNVMFEGSTWEDKITDNRPKIETYIKDNVPLNCFITPLDVARAVQFLEDSPLITGENIVVDGGQIRRIG